MSQDLKISVSALPHKGSVYFLRYGAGLGPCDEHYIVVLVPDCDPGHCLVIGVVTSQVRKRIRAAKENGFDAATVVQIAQSEFPEVLRVNSAVDCNSVKKLTRDYFEKITATAEHCTDMPSDLVDRILNGVILSDNVSDSIHELARSMLSSSPA